MLIDKSSYDGEIASLTTSNKKQILKVMRKSESSKRDFSYLSAVVGKGANKALSKVCTYNNKGELVKLSHDKETVERDVINYNKIHFK